MFYEASILVPFARSTSAMAIARIQEEEALESMPSRHLGNMTTNIVVPRFPMAYSLRKLSGALEKITNRFGRHLFESQLMDELRQSIGLPSFSDGDKATQFSVGLEYWSVAHKDDDYYYTTLSCLSRKDTDHDKILYYFVFPTYKLAVPSMRSGDVLFFNPAELHCCSNPSTEHAVIFSSYVSAKTFNTQYTVAKSSF